jgi:hypothetical protein
MIFVSYSHADEAWRKRFETMSKPLTRAEGVRFWSDRDIGAGEWEPQIEGAMHGAVAAVLLVSANFLASDYIVEKEVPFLLRAHADRGLMIFWAYLEPADLRRCDEITRFQAMTTGTLEPMSKMTDWQWQETMLRGCHMIDDFLRELERPVINPAVIRQRFPKLSENVPLLAKPSRRDVEVLVYSADKKWWRQWGIKAGQTTTKIQLGNDSTIPGAEFTVVALTTEKPLDRTTYLNIPGNRTKSEELILIRS